METIIDFNIVSYLSNGVQSAQLPFSLTAKIWDFLVESKDFRSFLELSLKEVLDTSRKTGQKVTCADMTIELDYKKMHSVFLRFCTAEGSCKTYTYNTGVPFSDFNMPVLQIRKGMEIKSLIKKVWRKNQLSAIYTLLITASACILSAILNIFVTGWPFDNIFEGEWMLFIGKWILCSVLLSFSGYYVKTLIGGKSRAEVCRAYSPPKEYFSLIYPEESPENDLTD